MLKSLEKEIQLIKRHRYQFLLLIPRNVNSTKLCDAVSQLGIPMVNVSLTLARQMKQIPAGRRPRRVKDELMNAMDCQKQETVFLRRINYLFDEELKQDPLGLIQAISGNKTILVEWPGEVDHGVLRYGTPDHPEYYERDDYQAHIIEL